MFFFIFTRIPTYYIIMIITQKYFVKVYILYWSTSLHLDIVTTGVWLLRNYLISLKYAPIPWWCYIVTSHEYIFTFEIIHCNCIHTFFIVDILLSRLLISSMCSTVWSNYLLRCFLCCCRSCLLVLLFYFQYYYLTFYLFKDHFSSLS